MLFIVTNSLFFPTLIICQTFKNNLSQFARPVDDEIAAVVFADEDGSVAAQSHPDDVGHGEEKLEGVLQCVDHEKSAEMNLTKIHFENIIVTVNAFCN